MQCFPIRANLVGLSIKPGRGEVKGFVMDSGKHSFCVAKQREMGVEIRSSYFSNSETSFRSMGKDRLIINHKISGVMLS